MYDNSFYFYFGLQPGNTALDEFKKTYYASCEKNDLFSQSASNISVIGLTTEYDGLSTTNGSGSLSYDKIIANNDILTNGLNIQLTSVNNEVIESIENDTTGDAHTFNNLKEGEYKLIISSSDGSISKELSVTIGRIRFSATLTPVSFKLNF